MAEFNIEASFEIKVPALRENLDKVMAFAENTMEKAGVPIRQQMQLAVSVEEIYVNIASYAYEGTSGDALIRAEILKDPKGIRFTFIDQGIPYDPLAKEDPDITLSAEEREIGGLGVFIVKQSMDKVSYEYKNGCNILSFIEYY